MITIYLENLRTTKVKGGKRPKPKPKPKPLKLPGLLQVNKKDPRDLLGEVLNFYYNFKFYKIMDEKMLSSLMQELLKN